MKNWRFFVWFTTTIMLLCSNCVGQHKTEIDGSERLQNPKYPFQFNTHTANIAVNSILNDSLPIRLVFDCGATFVWMDSTFVDNHYSYESKLTMVFEGVGTSGRQVANTFKDWKITIAKKQEEFPFVPAPNLRSAFNDSIDGVIGLIFIKKYVWAFDFGTHSFDILPVVPDSVRKNWHALKLELRDNMYYFESPFRLFVTDNASVSGKLLFDSGMSTDVCLFADVTRKLNLGSLNIDRKTVVSKGASGNSTSESFKAKHIVNQNFTADSITVRAKTDAIGYASKAPFEDVIGYFGFGLLQRMGEVVIDFPNQVLYFKPQS